MCVTIFCGECIHQWMRTRYRYMWPVPCTPHCTVYPGPVQGTAAPATNQSHNPELAPPTCNQFLPPPPRTSCTSPHIFVYYQLASKYFNDKYLQQRWSQCPHQCPPHTCHVSSLVTRLPAFGVTQLVVLDDTDPESILYSKQIAMYLIVDHKRI